MPRQKLIVLTGAGISAESGLKTFRDSGGLWEGYSVYDVATPEAFERDPEQVLEFYNQRRRDVLNAKPNAAHKALVDLEERYDVTIVTQNVDDLHERAGSSDVLHLHGNLLKARSTKDPNLLYDWKKDLNIGDTCEQGSQLRPHVVWFGELVPAIEEAAALASEADICLVVGTSMAVYPAAGLVNFVNPGNPIYVVNPDSTGMEGENNVRTIPKKATVGVPLLVRELLE
jgi:NAD-dependent deacetylase